MNVSFQPARWNRLLAALSAADYALLEPHLVPVSFKRGAVLYEVGDRIECVYFVQSGIVSLAALMRDGRAVETATIGREGAVGLVSGLGTRQTFNRSVMKVPGDTWCIDSVHLRQAVAQSDTIRDLVMRYMEALLAQVLQSVACNALHPVDARLARWLLTCRDRMDDNAIPVTQEFLAEVLGVQRTTVTLVARTLQRAGLISCRRGVVEIADREGLEEASCECYDAVRTQFEQLLATRRPGPAPVKTAHRPKPGLFDHNSS